MEECQFNSESTHAVWALSEGVCHCADSINFDSARYPRIMSHHCGENGLGGCYATAVYTNYCENDGQDGDMGEPMGGHHEESDETMEFTMEEQVVEINTVQEEQVMEAEPVDEELSTVAEMDMTTDEVSCTDPAY